MTIPALALLAGFLLSTSASARPAPAEPLTTVRPQWTATPSDDQLMAAVPAEARRRGVEGRALLNCKVSARGSLSSCTIMEETPPGMGFGMAGLRVAPRFRMRSVDQDGKPVGGGTVTIPITFKAGEPVGSKPLHH